MRFLKLIVGVQQAENDFLSFGYYEDIADLPQEVISSGILVESVLIPIEQQGKIPELHINPQTLEQWYEYKNTPTEERISQLEQLVADLASLQLGV